MALLLAAFAAGVVPGLYHRDAAHTVTLMAYAMPDGTLPVICGDGGAAHDAAVERCHDCRVVAAALPPTPRNPPLRDVLLDLVEPPSDLVAPKAVDTLAALARGPPAAFA